MLKHKLLIAAIVIICSIPLSMLGYQYYLAYGVSNYKVKNISHNKQLFTADRGRVLNSGGKPVGNYLDKVAVLILANSYRDISENPLIGAGGIDETEFTKYLAEIDRMQKEIISANSSETSFIPTDFLKSLLDVNSRRRELDAEISQESITKYLDTLDKSISKYNRQIADNLSVINGFQGKSTINTLFSVTDSSVVAKDYELMLKNSQKLSSELNHKNKILAGLSIAKRNQGEGKVQTIVSRTRTTTLPHEDLPTTRVYQIASEKQYTTRTACFDGESREKSFFLYRQNDKPERLIAKQVDDNYFLKIAGLENDKLFNDRGLEWERVTEGKEYRCMNNSYQADVLDMYSYSRNFSEPIIGRFMAFAGYSKLPQNVKESLQTALSSETEFYKSENWEYDDFQALAKNYRLVRNLLGGTPGEDNWEELIKELTVRYETISYRESAIHELYGSLFNLDSMLKSLDTTKQIEANTLKYMYIVRTNYAISYLNYSPLVWRLQDTPKYTKESKVDSVNFSRYDDLVKKIGLDKVREIESITKADEIDYLSH